MIFAAGADPSRAKRRRRERSYTVFRDQIETHIAEDYTITARWSFDGETLTFTDIDCCGGHAKGETVVCRIPG